MGDRCYMEITCLEKDAGRFKALGFREEGVKRGFCNMADHEANFAHSAHMPTDIPYYGENGEGENYGACEFACDGKEYAEAECNHRGELCVRIDEKGEPRPKDLKIARTYLAVLARAKLAMGMKKSFRWCGD